MNLTLLLDMARDGFGDRVVLGRRESGLTTERLYEYAHGGAGALIERGADSLLYLTVNGPAFTVALFAAAIAGVPLVPINYRLGEEQLDLLLAQHPGALVIADSLHQPTLTRHGHAAIGGEAWLDLAANAAPLTGQRDETAPAVIIYTSGTTSAPKGVLLRHQNLLAYVFNTVEFAAASADDAALVSVPPYHIAAVANVISNLYAGRRVLTLECFSAEQWLETVRSQHITNALVVPTMLARIMSAGPADLRVPSLRTLAYGGAAMPAPVIQRALERWPHVDFVNAYGLTETSSTIAILGPEDHRIAAGSDDPAVRARLSSAGRVVPSVELEIRAEDGTAVPAGTVGRIFVRGEQISGEYAGTGPALDDRGFFDSRDEGLLDADGYLFIRGRADDTIIRGGENIAPAEIESVLLDHDAVDDVVVIGLPDESWGQRLEAVIVLAPGWSVDESELREYVRARLRSSKTPDRVHCWATLPRTETGKLIRRDVVATLSPPVDTSNHRNDNRSEVTANG